MTPELARDLAVAAIVHRRDGYHCLCSAYLGRNRDTDRWSDSALVSHLTEQFERIAAQHDEAARTARQAIDARRHEPACRLSAPPVPDTAHCTCSPTHRLALAARAYAGSTSAQGPRPERTYD